MKKTSQAAVEGIIRHVRLEFWRALQQHGDFNSDHEGYAVMLEEFDELWEEIRKKRADRDYNNMYKEAIQIAAMGLKMAHRCAPRISGNKKLMERLVKDLREQKIRGDRVLLQRAPGGGFYVISRTAKKKAAQKKVAKR